MMTEKIKFLFLFFVIPISLIGQNVFEGIVYNNLSLVPESGVIISVYEGESIVLFSRTESDGSFSLTVEKPENKKVVFRKIGFEDFEVPFLKLQQETYLIKASKEREFLDEVVLTAEKNYMHSKTDTITYQAAQLRTAAATTVEDLIQNIPGVSVDKLTGAIRYRNVEISNILIDGDNITDSNYQLISKTLAEESAKAIQVIEGYSDNQLLKNFDRKNKVALNLQTDENYRNKLKGSIKAGYGFSDRYDESVNLIFLSKNAKTINIAGYNNIGDFSLGNIVSSKNFEPNSQPLLNYNELDRKSLSGKYDKQLRLSLYNTSNILENNDFTFSTNQSYNFGDHAKMKSNITYYKDNIRSSVLENITPYNEEDNSLFNGLYSTNQPENFDGNIEFSKIFQEKEEILLRVQFKKRQRFNIENGEQNNQILSVDNKIDNTEIRFLADYSRKINNRTALVLFNNSTLSRITEVDKLFSLYDFHFLDSLTNTVNQNFETKAFKNNFGVNYVYKITANNVLTAGLLFTNYNLQTNNLFRTENIYLENSLSNQKITNLSPQLQWSFFSREHSFSVLAKASNIKNDLEKPSTINFEITPEINYFFKRMTPKFHDIRISFRAQRKLDFFNFNEYNNTPMLHTSNYLYMNNNPSQIFFITNEFGLNTLYGFTKSGVELNSNFHFSFGKKPLIDNLSFFENYYYNEVLEQENDFRNLSVGLEFKKYFPKLGSNISLTPNYRLIHTENLIEDERKRNNLENYQVKLNIGAVVSDIAYFSFGSVFNYTVNTRKNIIGNTEEVNNRSFSGYFNTRLTFSEEKLIVNIQNEYIHYDKAEEFLYSSLFLRYKPKNSRFEFGLNLKNIFNNKSLSVKRPTTNYYYEKETIIIPRLLVFSANYVF